MKIDKLEVSTEHVRDDRKESTDHIHIIRLLESEVAKVFIDDMEGSSLWTPAVTHYHRDEDSAVDKGLWDGHVIGEPAWVERFKPIRDTIEAKLKRWVNTSKKDHLAVSALILARYGVGGHLRVHADSTPGINRFRRLSLVLYLNDDYEGGYTSFPLVGRNYRGTPGQAIFFPSHYIHRGEPVTRGKKYVLVFFLCDPRTAPPGF
jgi:hypothetical protein